MLQPVMTGWALWYSGYHYYNTSFNKVWTQLLRRFKSAQVARGMSKIWDSEDLWQWTRSEIRLNALSHSTIPQKQSVAIIFIATLLALWETIKNETKRLVVHYWITYFLTYFLFTLHDMHYYIYNYYYWISILTLNNPPV